MTELPETYFDSYDAFSEKEILSVTEKGITLHNGVYIDFSECVKNFTRAYPDAECCVGEKEVTDLSLTFYTYPKAIMIKFLYKNAQAHFCDFENTIRNYGYRLYDIT